MAKHKSKRRSSSSKHSRHPYRRHSSRESRRERSCRERSREHNLGDSRSPENLPLCRAGYSENLLAMLDQIRGLVDRCNTEHDLQTLRHSREVCSAVRECLDEGAVPMDDSSTREEVLPGESSAAIEEQESGSPILLTASEQLTEEQTVAQVDRGFVPGQLPGTGNDSRPPTSVNVSFANPSTTDASEAQNPEIPEDALVNELFGVAQTPQASSSWNPLVLQSIQLETRSGLEESTRNKLLLQYEVKGDVPGLVPPKLNKELVSVLPPSVVKRDEYQSSSQAQVGACLNALGSGISILLSPEVLQNLQEDARSALTFFSDCAHLLSDHQYRLSLARRAFAKPSLNVIGKNAAETAPIDDFLFGHNFTESLRAVQACKKVGREVIKNVPAPMKKILQPVRQQAPLHRTQPSTSRIPGNQKAPVRSFSARRIGAPSQKSRWPRSQSRSRIRQHQ